MPEKSEPGIDLSHISIVMVGTTHPGNIGAAARAMNNMCFKNLILVDPQCPVGEIAYARSSGAHAILDQLKSFQYLQDAISDSHLVVGLTARQRSLTWPQFFPEELATKIKLDGGDRRVALIFGREHSGLTNEELSLCNAMVSIPANPDFSSLNVASAIQVMCYEIYKILIKNEHAFEYESIEEPATSYDVEGFYQHLQQVLHTTEFLDADNPGQLMHRLRRLYQRTGLTKTEVNILRGILSSVEKYRN